MKGTGARILYHRDLAGWEWFQEPLDVNEFVWDFIGRVAGTHVDTFVLHMTYNLFPTKLKAEEYASTTGAPVGLVGNHATWAAKEGLTANSWRILEHRKAFWDRGIDPIGMLVDAAHEAGMSFFAGIRMNDVHHAQWDWHPKFWIEHPEYRIGDHPEYRIPRGGFREPGGAFQSQVDNRVPAALDFMHDEVRAYKLELIEEAARVYDVEGVELDFTRHPFFFKPTEVDKGRDRMTEFVAEVRKRLHEIAQKRGRPLMLEVRVPPTLKACWRIGLDVRRWIGDDLADIVAVAPYWHPDFGMPVEEFVDAAKGTPCRILASLEFCEMPALRDSCATAEVVRAAALAYWKAGVDGIHLFNPHALTHYLRQEMPFLREIGDPAVLEYLDKHYMVTRASNYDDAVWFSYPKALPAALKETPAGDGCKIRLRIGDDVTRATRLGIRAEATLRLRLMNLTGKDDLEFRFNGVTLRKEACTSEFFPMGEAQGLRQYPFITDTYFGVQGPYHWLEFKLANETLPRCGVNEVEVLLRKRNPDVTEGIILNDVEVKIRYGKL